MDNSLRVTRESLLAQANQWEYAILRVGYELLAKFVRTSQRSLEKEIEKVANNIQFFSKSMDSKADAMQYLKSQVNRLKELKEKLSKAIQHEKTQLEALKQRLTHAQVPHILTKKGNAQSISEWYNTRLSRVLFDYLMREGFTKTAELLLRRDHLGQLVDTKIYSTMRTIISSLEAQQCTAALKWCGENRTRLKKNNSLLELDLRIQEFLLMIEKSKLEAIKYARKWLQPHCSVYPDKVQRAMGALAFTSIAKSPYKSMLSSDHWNALIKQFKIDCSVLYGLPSSPMLCIDFQAGLALLKTEQCFVEDEKLLNCPVCQPPFNELSQGLPFSRKNISTLVCRISGKPMKDNNPPVALPNGYVYSKDALDEMAANNNGTITCPRTGLTCNYNDLKKIFIT